MYDLELLEDMDTSDDDDDEWGGTIERKRRQSRKQNPKTDFRSPEGVCCSCSKYSSCKTLKCECRAARGICSSGCSCGPTRCSNIEATKKEQPIANSLVNEEAESSHDLAAHGAMLLQTALSDKTANQSTDVTVRKPLSDIGNNLVSIIHVFDKPLKFMYLV